MKETETRPCENCGKLVTKTKAQASQRKYWTCGVSCSTKLAYRLGNIPSQWAENPYRGQQETRPCVVCGKPITRYLTPEQINLEWTCSHKCSGLWKPRGGGKKPRKGDIINCVVCGKEFYRQPIYIKQNRRLCSRSCNRKWQSRYRIEKKCLHCGAGFSIPPSQKAQKFCSKSCETNHKIKRPTGRMHNGRPILINFQGYLTVYEPTHPHANRSGRILEHRLIMEQKIGRPLMTREQVNHINHNKQDNRPENLEIMNPTEHSRETNNYAARKRKTMAERLAEYERRYGPLEDD